MAREELFDRLAEHRRVFAEVLDELGEEHAGDATLCAGWDVRTLAGHMLQPIRVPSWRFMITAARQRSMARACDVIATRLGDRPLADIAAEIRATAAHRTVPWYIGLGGPYTDSCIHLRDLAEPQGLAVTVPVERWVTALDIIVSERGQEAFVPDKGRLSRLHWEADDADWAHGAGRLIRGTAEALAMTISGRTAYLDRLTGDGVTVLQRS